MQPDKKKGKRKETTQLILITIRHKQMRKKNRRGREITSQTRQKNTKKTDKLKREQRQNKKHKQRSKTKEKITLTEIGRRRNCIWLRVWCHQTQGQTR